MSSLELLFYVHQVFVNMLQKRRNVKTKDVVVIAFGFCSFGVFGYFGILNSYATPYHVNILTSTVLMKLNFINRN